MTPCRAPWCDRCGCWTRGAFDQWLLTEQRLQPLPCMVGPKPACNHSHGRLLQPGRLLVLVGVGSCVSGHSPCGEWAVRPAGDTGALGRHLDIYMHIHTPVGGRGRGSPEGCGSASSRASVAPGRGWECGELGGFGGSSLLPVWQFGRGWWQVASPCHPCLAVAALSWTVPGRVCAAAFKLCVPAGWSTKSTCGSTPAPQHKAQHSRGSPLAAMRQLGLLQCVVRLYISALAAAAAVAPRASCGCWCPAAACAVLCCAGGLTIHTPAHGASSCLISKRLPLGAGLVCCGGRGIAHPPW